MITVSINSSFTLGLINKVSDMRLFKNLAFYFGHCGFECVKNIPKKDTRAGDRYCIRPVV